MQDVRPRSSKKEAKAHHTSSFQKTDKKGWRVCCRSEGASMQLDWVGEPYPSRMAPSGLPLGAPFCKVLSMGCLFFYFFFSFYTDKK